MRTLVATCLTVLAVGCNDDASPDHIVWDRGTVLSNPRLLEGVEVRADDLPAIVEAMSHSSSSLRYAALAFDTPDRSTDDDTLNVQVSVENGKVGFDWLLLAPRNIEDQDEFRTFARARGAELSKRTMNGVSYLRVEDVDAAKFAASVVTDMYHLPENEPVWLYHEGFKWPQN